MIYGGMSSYRQTGVRTQNDPRVLVGEFEASEISSISISETTPYC